MILDEASAVLREKIEEFADVILFNRSRGWNDDVVHATDELHSIVSVGKLNRTYLFVASSLGAFTAFSFCNRYPNEINAIVLLDPSHPRQGISALNILNSHEIPYSRELEELKRFFQSTNIASETGASELAKIQSLHELPVLIVAAGALSFPDSIPKDVQELLTVDRHTMLSEYTKLSKKGKFMVVPNVGHGIAHEAPDLVAEIVASYIQELFL